MTALRIKRLTLTDFRAFPGPTPAHFDLDSKNLLVYGENGSGKSSIFYALSGFFSLKPTKLLRYHKNVFSSEPVTNCAVTVEFNDGAPSASWYSQATSGAIGASAIGTHAIGTRPVREFHPATISGGDVRVTQTALRRGCLDYRALLDTNYKHGDDPVNLFDIAIERLLSDFPVTTTNGVSRTIRELWEAVEHAKPRKHSPPYLARIDQTCIDFNRGLNQALSALHPIAENLLIELIGEDVKIATFAFGGISYNAAYYKRDRQIINRSIAPDIRFRAHQLGNPHHFLNEARLSALALAIYLAGRLACTPTATPNALNLLVLDDVLIGLDHSNRLPVLDVLKRHFANWQVILLTYDRNWFDLARSHLPYPDWKLIEIYEGDGAANAPMPIIRATQNKPARALLKKANELLLLGYVEAAANYARQAFELGVRAACEVKGIAMPYRVYPKTQKPPLLAQDFLDKLKGWPGSANVPKADWNTALTRLETLKNIVMNPYSHPSAPNIPRQEVTDGIAAVTTFLDLVAAETKP